LYLPLEEKEEMESEGEEDFIREEDEEEDGRLEQVGLDFDRIGVLEDEEDWDFIIDAQGNLLM